MNSRQTAAVFGGEPGKGPPMQTKKLGNGGPTMRSRAILAGGR